MSKIQFAALALCGLMLSAVSVPALAQTAGMAMPAGKSPADAAMAQGMAKMNQGMADAPMTGNPDHDFVTMMIPHHAGAVSMAEVELRYGHDPELRRLSREIIAAQNKEIAEMQAWLTAHPTP